MNAMVTIKSGSDHIFPFQWVAGANLKMAKVQSLSQGIIQLEYSAMSALNNIAWDLSLIDGTADGVPGNPFAGYNLTVSPTGNLGNPACKQTTCPALPPSANQRCGDAYWFWNDDAIAMRVCSP